MQTVIVQRYKIPFANDIIIQYCITHTDVIDTTIIAVNKRS